MKLISEGTKSVLFGSHSIIHSFFVAKAWKILYKQNPTLKELFVILVHDLGYCGTNHLTNKTNAGHAELGANICKKLLGPEYYFLALGHSSAAQKKFNIPASKLELPDEYSWIIAPMWWLEFNHRIEKFPVSAKQWKNAVTKNFYLTDKKSGTDLLNSLRK